MRSRIIVIVAILLVFSPYTQNTYGQNSLSPFSSVTGNIGPGETQDWIMSAIDGEVISLIAEGTGDLDPVITLISETGAVLIQNDDYDYPISNTAIIQSVTIPFTGTYTVRVSGFDDSAGTYSLTRLRGFADGFKLNGFTNGEKWTSENEILQIALRENRLTLTIEDSPDPALAVNSSFERLSNYYTQTNVRILEGRPGWVVHMTLNQQAANRYYLFSISHQGLWRMALVINGEETILRDWVSHPAIIPGETQFDMSAFVNPPGVDLFYNGTLLGQIVDNTLQDGIVGLGIEAIAGLDTIASAEFENFFITVPMKNSTGENLLPDQLIITDPVNMTRALERRLVIPPGGELMLNVAESSLQSADIGISRLPLGRGATFSNFVISAEITIEANENNVAGCGLYMRAVDDNNYLVGYIDQTGGYGLSSREGNTFAPGIFGEDGVIGQTEHHVLIVANNNQLRYYIDGRLVGQLEQETAEGTVGNAVINFEPNTTLCNFENTWLWRW